MTITEHAAASRPKGVDWNALTDDEWKLGPTALAAKFKVSKPAAHAAWKRRHGSGATARPTVGRKKSDPPANLDRTQPVATLAKEHGVSIGTVYRWFREQREEA